MIIRKILIIYIILFILLKKVFPKNLPPINTNSSNINETMCTNGVYFIEESVCCCLKGYIGVDCSSEGMDFESSLNNPLCYYTNFDEDDKVNGIPIRDTLKFSEIFGASISFSNRSGCGSTTGKSFYFNGNERRFAKSDIISGPGKYFLSFDIRLGDDNIGSCQTGGISHYVSLYLIRKSKEILENGINKEFHYNSKTKIHNVVITENNMDWEHVEIEYRVYDDHMIVFEQNEFDPNSSHWSLDALHINTSRIALSEFVADFIESYLYVFLFVFLFVGCSCFIFCCVCFFQSFVFVIKQIRKYNNKRIRKKSTTKIIEMKVVKDFKKRKIKRKHVSIVPMSILEKPRIPETPIIVEASSENIENNQSFNNPPLPQGWVIHYNKMNKRHYYKNPSLPLDWKIYWDSEKKDFLYVNSVTSERKYMNYNLRKEEIKKVKDSEDNAVAYHRFSQEYKNVVIGFSENNEKVENNNNDVIINVNCV